MNRGDAYRTLLVGYRAIRLDANRSCGWSGLADNAIVLRRVFVDQPLGVGRLRLDAESSHYLRTVLRLPVGQPVEVFNAAGACATARIESLASEVELNVERVEQSPPPPQIVIAAAVPKGDRADWMIEKLSEIGVTRFVPLATQRSVVLPSGASKFERWRRIAQESARQSRRVGVMTIDSLTPLTDCLNASAQSVFLTTVGDAPPLSKLLSTKLSPALLIGPEGGWSEEELADFAGRALTGATLGPTILRVETAAVVAAAIASMAAL